MPPPEDRLAALESKFDDFQATATHRFDEGKERMDSFERMLTANSEMVRENTLLTRSISDNTAGFVAFQNDLIDGTRFLCRCARGVSWLLKTVKENVLTLILVAVIVSWALHLPIPDSLMKLIKLIAA